MINVIGTIFNSSGYASHTRGLVNELNKLTDVKITTSLTQGYEREVNDAELEMIKKEEDYEINLIITHPIYWKVNMSAKRNFCYLVWEGDSIPQWMVEECRNPRIEKIIVPSEHTRLALVRTLRNGNYEGELHKMIRDKLVVIPHGHNPTDFYPQARKGENKPFRFLANKGFRNMEDRGGIMYLIKAYIEEFKDEDKEDVELILKINTAYGIPDIKAMFPGMKEKPVIKVIQENLTTKQMNDMYNDCDVFVSPTRAEAFNLPILESCVVGKPCIVTGYGGQCDFVNNKNGWLIDYKLVPVTHEIEYEGCSWAVPDHNHLKKLLRHTYSNRDEVIEKGKEAMESCKHLTWENTAKQINDLV